MGNTISNRAFSPRPSPYVGQIISGIDEIPFIHIRVIEGNDPSKVILFAQGRDTTIHLSLPRLLNIAKLLDVSIVTFDYPGFGVEQVSEPCESIVYKAGLHVYDWIHETYSECKVIAWGEDIGCAVVGHIATNRLVYGVMLESPVTSWMGLQLNIAQPLFCLDFLDLLTMAENEAHLWGRVVVTHTIRPDGVALWHAEYIYQAIIDRKGDLPQPTLHTFDSTSEKSIVTSEQIVPLFMKGFM